MNRSLTPSTGVSIKRRPNWGSAHGASISREEMPLAARSLPSSRKLLLSPGAGWMKSAFPTGRVRIGSTSRALTRLSSLRYSISRTLEPVPHDSLRTFRSRGESAE
jgi:hypothetical protein